MSEAPRGLELRIRQTSPIPLDAAFRIAPRELVALVGPSGSGKTTLLRCIAGLHRPAEGFIACDGDVWFDSSRRIFLPPQRRPVGLVFQHYALFPHMTALGNVMCALGGLAKRERKERASHLLRAVGLGDHENRRPALLSGGQQQRVALARAMAREPAVLLLDEPFSAVDRRMRRALQAQIAGLRAAMDSAIVLVTHDLNDVAAIADRVLVMSEGRIVMDGPPARVLSQPAGSEVAGLLDL
jgi:molybdate transport system ATP-binding protein